MDFIVSENGHVLYEGGVCASRLPLETGVTWAVITSYVGKRCAQTRQLFTAENRLSTDAAVIIIQKRIQTFKRVQNASR